MGSGVANWLVLPLYLIGTNERSHWSVDRSSEDYFFMFLFVYFSYTLTQKRFNHVGYYCSLSSFLFSPLKTTTWASGCAWHQLLHRQLLDNICTPLFLPSSRVSLCLVKPNELLRPYSIRIFTRASLTQSAVQISWRWLPRQTELCSNAPLHRKDEFTRDYDSSVRHPSV